MKFDHPGFKEGRGSGLGSTLSYVPGHFLSGEGTRLGLLGSPKPSPDWKRPQGSPHEARGQ